jgi:glycosyltransferase involved in cell wall biosynthesis
MNRKISVVIAAYNEASRIGNVLKVVCASPLIDEIIVVDDGSIDGTANVAEKYDVQLIRNNKNQGKTLSVKRGVEASKNDIIMLLDADLRGLDQKSIEKLAKPVIEGRVDWTLSRRKDSFNFMKLMKMEAITGERVVPKKLLLNSKIWAKPKVSYGFETLMNQSLLDKKTTFQSIYLKTLYNTKKSEKMGFIKGWVGEFKMLGEIMQVLPLRKFVKQLIVMSYLNRKYSKL